MNIQAKEWVSAGLLFGLGFSFADQLMWYFFDIIKMFFDYSLC